VSFKLPLLAAASAAAVLGLAGGAHASVLANVYAGYYQDTTWMYYWNTSGVTIDDAQIASVGGLFPGESEDEYSLCAGCTESVNFYNGAGAFAGDYDDANGVDGCGSACDTVYQFQVTIGGHTYFSNLFSPTNNLTGNVVDFTGNHFDNDTISCNMDNFCDGFALVAQVSGGAPEPAAWSLMIGGFGLAGAALRRRLKVAA
jgi:hypothetical protein